MCSSASRTVRGASPVDLNVQASAIAGTDVRVPPGDRALTVGVPVLVDAKRMRPAQLCRVGEFELMRDDRIVVGADDDVFARHAREQPHGSAAIVLCPLGGRPTSVRSGAGASSRCASRLDFRLCRSRPPSDAARTPRRSYRGAARSLIDSLRPLLGAQLVDLVLSSGSHLKMLLAGQSAAPAR